MEKNIWHTKGMKGIKSVEGVRGINGQAVAQTIWGGSRFGRRELGRRKIHED